MPRSTIILASLTLLLGFAADALSFDRVLLKDGRVISGKLIESDDENFVILRLPGADIPIDITVIDRTYVEDMEDYVPKNSKEAKYMKQGKVLFEGSWMSRTRREQALQKSKDIDKAAIDKLRQEQKWKNHKHVSTRHFDIYSNCTEEVLDEYVRRIEQFYNVFTDYWNIKLSPSEGKSKMKFFLYRTSEDFHEVTGTRQGVGGYFSFPLRELQLYDDMQNPEETLDTLQHEANHLLTYLINTKFAYPRWMNEGMAEYFGSADVSEDGDIALGALQYMRIASLRSDRANGRVKSMRDVLLATPGEYGFRHYAYGWSFVHFLMESEEYGKSFRSFFKNIHKNNDVEVTNVSYSNVKGALSEPDLRSVTEVLEKTLGKSIEELEQEMHHFGEQAYGELNAYGYYRAARMSRREPLDDDEHIVNAMLYFEKAIELGYDNANCFREYAEMLRKGGVDDTNYTAVIREPDPSAAYAMAKRAIEADPIGPLNYCEAAGALMMSGPDQDLDQALAMTETALALAPRDWFVQSLTDELLSKIEPAREQASVRAEAKRQLAENDQRQWTVQPFYVSGTDKPDTIDGLSTDELHELIQAGEFTGQDWVFQTWRAPDPETGELFDGIDPWDLAWVALKDVEVFAEDLAAANEDS
ncbi:MAG: hypothetical protein ACI9EF_002609 [Pseudohongiellaceae bacterium]|jgi:hypothetical protein